MRIVFLNPSGQLGGAETCLLDILAGLRSAEPGWRLHLICGNDGPLVQHAREIIGEKVKVLAMPPVLARLGDAAAGGPAGDQISRIGLIFRLAWATGAVCKYAVRLRRELARLSPDLVQTNGFKMHALGVWSKPPGVPLIWHVHDFVRQRPVMARVFRHGSRVCATALAASNAVAAELAAVCKSSLRVVPLYNGVDLYRFSPHGPTLDLDVLSGMPPVRGEVVRIGLVATMARWKGHAVFLQAISRLPKELPIRAYVIGNAVYDTEGSQASIEELRLLTAELGLGGKVGFTGFVDDVPSALRALDIVVHASTQPEPFGLVIAEAMSCGRAVIATSSAGAAELFRFGEDALAHPPGDADALSEQIRALVIDPERRMRLGTCARATALRQFNRRRLAAQLASVYHRLVYAERGAPASGLEAVRPSH